jgi:O-antigen/teichoic acid export membrane protein
MNHTLRTIFFQGINFSLQVVFALLTARLLGIEQQGTYALIRTSAFLAESLIWVGLSSAITYFVAKDFNKYHDIILNGCMWYLFLFSIIATGIVTLLSPSIFSQGISKELIFLSILWTMSIGSIQIFQKIFLGQRRYGAYNSISLAATFLLYPILYLIHKMYGLNLISVISCHFLANILSLTLAIYLHRFWTRRIKLSELMNKKIIGALYKTGFKGFSSSVTFLILYRCDFFFVGYFLGRNVLGLYSIAVFVVESIQKIPDWMAIILSPKVTANLHDANKLTRKYLWPSVGYSIMNGIALLGMHQFGFRFIEILLGQEYRGAENIVVMLTPKAVLHATMVIFAANLAGKGYTYYHPLAGLLSLVALVTIDFVLIPLAGLKGAIVGITFSYIIATTVMGLGTLKTCYKNNKTNSSPEPDYLVLNN